MKNICLILSAVFTTVMMVTSCGESSTDEKSYDEGELNIDEKSYEEKERDPLVEAMKKANVDRYFPKKESSTNEYGYKNDNGESLLKDSQTREILQKIRNSR